MTPETLARLSEIYDRAAGMGAAEREAWLAQLAAEDASLAPGLQALLAGARRETADLLDRGPAFAAPEAAADAAFAAGDAVGPYRLLRRLGEGGMGEVWLAERRDGQLKRSVALKLPMLGLRRSVLVQRFARERDILASLEHPNIARLYDAGLDDDGQPYLALEYVQGEPIDAWCRAHRPSVAATLRLLLQVADAVAFAHGRLVLHRDLKPANILVTAEGQVRLLDFGIAKLIESEGEAAGATELTHLGGRAMTPRYASPEQLRGEALTTASDVYSLAVVAYELLAGVSPYPDTLRTPAALEQAVAQGTLPPASERCDDAALRGQLRGDLDAILAHALRARPGDRYPSVDALAADLRRHLQGEQVLVHPEGWWERGRRFALRHRLPLALAASALLALAAALGLGATALVTLALAAGLAGALWQARRAREQARRARTEARTAESVKAFLMGVFRASSADQADPTAARRRTALELLDDGARRIEHELDDAPEAKVELLETLAEMYADLGLGARTMQLREAAVRTAERSFGPRSPMLARTLARLAMALADEGRLQRALPALQRAESVLALQRSVEPALRQAVDIAWCDYYRFARDPAGLPFAERAAAHALRQAPDNDWLNTLALLGVMQRLAGRLELSLQSFERAVALAPQVPGGAASVLAAVHQEAATTAMALGDAVRSEDHLRRTLEIDTRAGGPASSYAVMDRRELGLFLLGQGRDAQALEQFALAREQARAIAEEGERLGTTRALCAHESWLHRLLGDPERALAASDEAYATETGPGEVPTTAALMRLLRCDALLDLGRIDEAEAAWREGRTLRTRFGLDSPAWQVQDAFRAVRLLTAQGRARDAVEQARDHLSRFGGALSKTEPDLLVQLLLALGSAEAACGLADDAAASATEALRRIETPPRPRMVAPLRRQAQELARLVRARD